MVSVEVEAASAALEAVFVIVSPDADRADAMME